MKSAFSVGYIPGIGRLAVLFMLLIVIAALTAKEASASQNTRPAASLLTFNVTWEVSERDGPGNYFPARYLFTEICDAAGTGCYADSFEQLDTNGSATLTTSQYVGGDVVVKLYALAEINGNSRIQVYDQFGGSSNWEAVTAPFQPSNNSSWLVQINFIADLIPAFWLMDDFVTGFLKIPSADQPSIMVEGRWHFNFDSMATYPGGPTVTDSFFCYGTTLGWCLQGWMYLFQPDIRADAAFDNVGKPNRVAIHEMGHSVMYYLYEGNMPAPNTDYVLDRCYPWCPHSALSGQADCAFQEGWADFWRLYVLDSSTIQYVNGASDNYETSDGETWAMGWEVPGRITAALWDIYDSPQDKYVDTLADGLNGSNNNGIWKIISIYEPVDILQFDQYWLSSNPNHCAQSLILLNEGIQSQPCVETCGGNPPNIAGTSKAEFISGSPNSDVIVGLGGADYVFGNNGHDILCGDNGNDIIYGGTGDDQIEGGSGSDSLYGEDDYDTLRGDGGVDYLYGGNHNDSLYGGNHDDYLYGEAGNDTLRGNDNFDELDGGSGDDILLGGPDKDYLDGYVGYDDCDGGTGVATVYNCETGNSYVICDGLVAVLVGGNGGDTILGTLGDDVIAGKNGNDTIYGYGGIDRLCGGDGDDVIYGGDGNDIIYGKDGNDWLYGEAGNDNIYGAQGDDKLFGNDGDDLLDGGQHVAGDECTPGTGVNTVERCEIIY